MAGQRRVRRGRDMTASSSSSPSSSSSSSFSSSSSSGSFGGRPLSGAGLLMSSARCDGASKTPRRLSPLWCPRRCDHQPTQPISAHSGQGSTGSRYCACRPTFSNCGLADVRHFSLAGSRPWSTIERSSVALTRAAPSDHFGDCPILINCWRSSMRYRKRNAVEPSP